MSAKEIVEVLLESSDTEEESDEHTDLLYFFSDSSDSESSEDSFSTEKHVCIENFSLTIENYSDSDFKSHFRLDRQTVHFLIDLYRNYEGVPSTAGGRRPRIGPDKEIYIFLWYMGNTETFRQIGNLFGVCKSAARTVVIRVSEWLVSIGHHYLKWPEGDDMARTTAAFERKHRIPGIIGAIDCSHIRIKAPREHKECYFNRKHTYSVHLQAVVDYNKKFIDIYCGEPGSLHDSRVLRRSQLFLRAELNEANIVPQNNFIIGDSAYPVKSWLVPPYKDNGSLSDQQRQFNKLLSSARIVVENAFGLLKTRFRRLLHFTEILHLNLVTNLIASACILHNICLLQNDGIEIDLQEYEDWNEINGSDNNRNAFDRRDELLNYLINKNIITS